MSLKPSLPALGLTAWLAACSPYAYPDEVATLRDGVDQLDGALRDGGQAMAADRAAERRLAMTDARARAVTAASCGDVPWLGAPVASSQVASSQVASSPVASSPAASSPAASSPAAPGPAGAAAAMADPCRLVRPGDRAPGQDAAARSYLKALQATAALKAYAHGLSEVTEAKDRAAFDAAVAKLADGVAGLAGAAGPAGGLAGTASVDLLGWLAGAALDRERFDVLKAAVDAVGRPGPDGAKPPVDVVASALRLELQAIGVTRMTSLSARSRALAAKLGPGLDDARYRERFDEAAEVTAAMEALRECDPGRAATSLEAAHRALVAAVDDPGRSYAALVVAVGAFADDAAQLRDALSSAPAAPAHAAKPRSKEQP